MDGGQAIDQTCWVGQVFDETSEEIRQRMQELASQAAEVQAASKALDQREQQLSVFPPAPEPFPTATLSCPHQPACRLLAAAE
jgi:hypothetical protein